MSLATHLRRSLMALPLLALGVAAIAVEPPALADTLRATLAGGVACEPGARPAGALGLARMPGDLGLVSRRISCAG